MELRKGSPADTCDQPIMSQSQLSIIMLHPMWGGCGTALGQNNFAWVNKNYLNFDSLVWLMSAHPSTNMEEVGFINSSGAGHLGAIKMFWLHLLGAVMSSIFMCRV